MTIETWEFTSEAIISRSQARTSLTLQMLVQRPLTTRSRRSRVLLTRPVAHGTCASSRAIMTLFLLGRKGWESVVLGQGFWRQQTVLQFCLLLCLPFFHCRLPRLLRSRLCRCWLPWHAIALLARRRHEVGTLLLERLPSLV